MNKAGNWLSSNCKFAQYADIAPPNQYVATPKDSSEPKRQFVQWMSSDEKSYFPASEVVKTVPPGLYDIKSSMSGIYFERAPISLEGIVRFADTASDRVIKELDTFWQSEPKFRNNKIAYKRGLLLYGPAGSGKTSTIKIVASDMINRGGIIVRFGNSNTFADGMRILREVQPKTPVVALMEDLDAILDRNYESDVLNLLDGVEGVDKVAFIATTNYPEKLGSRIMNRPSRFDKKIFIGMPNAEARKTFLATKLEDKSEVDAWAKDTDGLSIAHLKELVVAVKILGDTYKDALDTLKGMKQLIHSDQFDDFGKTVAEIPKYAAYGTGKMYRAAKTEKTAQGVPNVRIRGNGAEVAGSWIVEPGNKAKLDRIKKELAEIQAEEPNMNWHLETRGTHADWHPWKD